MAARVWAVGAWGVGNVGDDAILEALRRQYGRRLRAVFPDRLLPSHLWAVTADELKQQITAEDTLVLGGGVHFDGMAVLLDLALRALGTGACVLLRGAGFEGAAEPAAPEMTRLLGICDHIEVRSAWSAAFVRELGYECVLGHDLAFGVSAPAPLVPQQRPIELLFVARADGALSRADVEAKLAELVARQPVSKAGRPSVIVTTHVPVHLLDGDLGELEWCGDMVERIGNGRVALRVIRTVEEALALYRQAKRVVTMRYHGLVFAALMGCEGEAFPADELMLSGFHGPVG